MNKRREIIFPVICLVVMAIILAVILAEHDGIVINHGIRYFNAVRAAALAAAALSLLWVAVTVVRGAKRKPEPLEAPDTPGERPLTEEDRQALYQELTDFAARKWRDMDGISKLLAQMDSMDEYQAELGRLLKQTQYLQQKPAEIVQRVEDCMYINIKKLLNYMRIIQNKSRDVMSGKVAECVEKNAGLLKKTDDFVVAVVGYVNGDLAPGEEDKTKDCVDSYMFVVLQAIELPETYLK